MATPTNLKIDGLDFQSIKDNFKTFLKAQDKFKDYNFDAAGLNVLVDLLSYNTYYNSFYVNMVSNEAFLSTAQRRNSIVAAAKSLNYVPRSRTSARVVATLTVEPVGTPSNVLIPRYTSFSAAATDGTDVTFVNLDPITVFSSDSYVVTGATLVEGTYVAERYTVNTADTEQRFIINNTDIDTTTLRVRVQNSSTDSTIRTFNRADNYVNLTSDSLVYFIQEIEDGYYEVTFGDGTFGASLLDGNVILLDYLSSNGATGNDITGMSFAGSISGVVDIGAVVTTASYGGDDRESIERIRYNAPKAYAAQNRLITTDDYISLVLQQPNVQSAIAWGGEDNDPPYYGRVFIAIQPKNEEVLTDTEKFNLTEYIIKPRKILTMSTEIVDPEYIYLIIDASVKYDTSVNVLNSTNLTSLVLQRVMEYKDSDLSQFSKYFRYSKLSRIIDTSDRSILSSTLRIQLRKEIEVQLNINASYVIDFANPIDDITKDRAANHPYAAGNKISSNAFTYQGFSNCYLEENGGVIRVYRQSGANLVGVAPNIGTLDYDTGRITLNSFIPESFADGGTTLKVTAVPREPDILPLRTQIITIREEDVTVNLINDNAISLTKR